MQNDFPAGIVNRTTHRPWALPGTPWLMTQSWHNVLFAHWPVDTNLIRTKLPAGFAPDVFNGHAWISVVPFRMTNVAPRFVPALPFVSEFAEVNVRTYVTVGGRPGVYFFSLDAESPMAVAAARTLLHLPYFTARMNVAVENDQVRYSSRRTAADSPPAELAVTYRPVGSPFEARPGTLDYFLTERYCLYNVGARSRAYRLEIHHLPWTLRRAEAAIELSTMTEAAGIAIPRVAPILHFAARQDTLAWPPETLESVNPS